MSALSRRKELTKILFEKSLTLSPRQANHKPLWHETTPAHPYQQKLGRQMAAIDSRPRRPLSNAHPPNTPNPSNSSSGCQRDNHSPITIPQWKAGWPQARQKFATGEGKYETNVGRMNGCVNVAKWQVACMLKVRYLIIFGTCSKISFRIFGPDGL